MKNTRIGIGTGILILVIFLAACSPHFHLDLLGKEQIEEVVLIKSREELDFKNYLKIS